jgi:hypothetical protein
LDSAERLGAKADSHRRRHPPRHHPLADAAPLLIAPAHAPRS